MISAWKIPQMFDPSSHCDKPPKEQSLVLPSASQDRHNRSVLIALVDQAIISGTSFLHLIAAARCLTMEDFGAFNLAWAILLFMGSIHHALILQPLAVLFAEYAPQPAKAYLFRIEQWHRWLPMLILPAGIGAALFPTWAGIILTTAISCLFRMASEHERRTAYVLNDSGRALVIDSICYGPLGIAAAWCLWRPMPLTIEIVILAPALPALAAWLAGIWLFKPARIPDNGTKPEHPILAHWNFGKWALLSTIAMYASSQIYPFLIAGYLSLREVAQLAASRSILGIVNVIYSGLEAYYIPQTRRSFVEGGWQNLKRTIFIMTLVHLFLLLPIVGFFMLFSRFLLGLIYPSDGYTEGAWMLELMAIIFIFQIANRIPGIALNAMKQPQYGALAYISAAMATVALGPTVVQVWGVQGAIAAIGINAAVIAAITCYFLFYFILQNKNPEKS